MMSTVKEYLGKLLSAMAATENAPDASQTVDISHDTVHADDSSGSGGDSGSGSGGDTPVFYPYGGTT